MKGKKKILVVLASVLLVVATLTPLVLSTSAADETPVLSIDYCNLSFSDSIYIKYAVASNKKDAKVLIWTAPQNEYTKGTEEAILSSVGTEEISGKEYSVFNYTDLAAKQMTDVVYARVWVQEGGEDYYSAPHKYSILQYVYNKNGKLGNTSNENLKKLLGSMLSYGSDAQTYFEYKTDRLATSDFYQVKLTEGKLSDGFKQGLYMAGEKVQLTAPTTDGKGGTFSHWQNTSGTKVSVEASFELTVTSKNEEYTPVYVKVSKGLEIDEEGYVLSIGDCTDTEIVIPALTEDGTPIIGIDNSAFAGEPITSISLPSTLEDIGRKAFNGCTALTDVYYDGTEEEWNEKVSVSSGNDALLNATFHFVTPPAKTFTVIFKDHDGAVLKTETVEEGKSATAPTEPTREGYTFAGWDVAFDNITSDLTVTAKYEKIQASYTKPTLVVDHVSAKAGETVQVAVNLYENPGLVGMTLKLSYDESAMTLRSLSRGNALSEMAFTAPQDLRSGCRLPWDAEKVLPENATNGDIVVFEFVISSSASVGNYDVSLSYDDGAIIDNDLMPVAIEILNGTVSVTK